MKRNSMLTKIIAVLLCALMVAAWLPKTSAAAANDFESAPDRDLGSHAANAMTLVIGTNAELFPNNPLTNTYYAYTPAEDGTLTLTAAEGTTLTVDGVDYTDAVAVTAGTKYIIVATSAAKNHSFTAAFEVPPTGPEFRDDLYLYATNIGLGGYVSGFFTVNWRLTPANSPYDEVYISVKHNFGDGSEPKVTEIKELHPAAGGYFIFEYPVASKQMNDVLEVTVHARTGDQEYVGTTIEWSVKQGILYYLDTNYSKISTNETSAKLCTLMADMLKYGALSQETFDYDTDNLVTKGVDSKYLDLATAGDPDISYKVELDAYTTKNDVMWRVGLGLTEKIEMYFTMNLTGAKSEYQIYVNDQLLDDSQITDYGGGVFFVNYSGQIAKELREVVTVKIFRNGAQVGRTYNVSVEGCAKVLIDGNSYVELAKAVMRYCDSSKAYFG